MKMFIIYLVALSSIVMGCSKILNNYGDDKCKQAVNATQKIMFY